MNEDTPEVNEMSDEDSARLDQFKEDISNDFELSADARDAANEDMRFINVPGGMWENFLEEDFDQDRVKLELDLVSDFLSTFVGEWNQNRIGVEFKADDSATSKDDADLINGIYRFDFRKGSGKLATDNAVDEAATCGVGAMKLATVFEDEEDPENDNQSIEWRPIYNAYSSVAWDSSAKRIDKRDAGYCTQLEQYIGKGFEKAFPGHKPVSAHTPDDRRWLNNTAAQNTVFVATRYEVTKVKVTMHIYNNLETGEIEAYDDEDHEEIKDDLKGDELKVFIRTRKISKQVVEKTVFSGDAILEPTRRIAGKWIPIIPIYGYRAYVDGIETYRGLVRKFKDAGRLFNMQVSQLAENAASAGQEVPIFAKSQMVSEDVQNVWADKNNKPYLIVDPLVDPQTGAIVAAGPIGYNKPAMLDQSTSTLLGIVPDFIQNVTGAAPNEAFSSDMSGKAIKALVKRENLKTQVVTDNIANAIVWSGTVYQAMASEIYNTKRIMQTVGKDGTEGETQLLSQVFDQESGRFIEANDLSGKKFQSYPDAGPQYETLAEQSVEELKGMMETLAGTPEGAKYMPVMLASMIDNISGVGLDPLKEFNRKIMVAGGMVKPITPEEEQIAQQAQQPKEDPNAKLAAAAAQQQLAEAESLRASAQQKTADAGKKLAETQKIQQETGLGDRQIVAKQQEQLLGQVFNNPAAEPPVDGNGVL
jgi:hypothetical protein